MQYRHGDGQASTLDVLGLDSMHAILYASAMELVSMSSSSRPAFDLAMDHIARAKHAISKMTVIRQVEDEALAPDEEGRVDKSDEEDFSINPVDGEEDDVSPFDQAEALPRVLSCGRPKTSRFKSLVQIPPCRRKMKETGASGDGPGTRSQASKPKCRICGSADHMATKCPGYSVTDKPVKPRKCHACGEERHYRNTCGRKSTYNS